MTCRRPQVGCYYRCCKNICIAFTLVRGESVRIIVPRLNCRTWLPKHQLQPHKKFSPHVRHRSLFHYHLPSISTQPSRFIILLADKTIDEFCKKTCRNGLQISSKKRASRQPVLNWSSHFGLWGRGRRNHVKCLCLLREEEKDPLLLCNIHMPFYPSA